MDVILPDQLPGMLARQQAQAATAVAVSEEPARTPMPSLKRFSQQLRALSALNAHLICMDADKPVYNQMVQGVGRVMNADLCALFLLSPATDHLDLVGVAGAVMPAGSQRLELDDVQRPAVQAFQEEYLIHVSDLQQMRGVSPLLQGNRSLLAMPIMGREGPVGAFEFARRATGGFTGEEIDLAGVLVDQMAYQLENYRLIRQLSASRDAVIHGMARLAESRGGDIGGHLDRICAYSQRLASRLLGRPGYLGLVNDEWVATLTRAAALHDIGKVGIPDRILLKPGALDEDEYLTMKTHARIGAEVLQDLMLTHGPFPMLEMGMQIALNHHERWDGSGYPQGLSGTAIPLSARIVALADVYDALTSKRVYKSAWTREETLSQMIGLAGSHFDPDLVTIFLQDADELDTIQQRFPD